MPRTLTPAVDQAIVASTYGYDVLIESDDLAMHLSWFFEGDATGGGGVFEDGVFEDGVFVGTGGGGWQHRLLRVDNLEIGIPSGGGVGFVSQLTFTIAQDPGTQSLLQLNEDFLVDGATITLKLLFHGELYGAAIPLFQGQVSTWEVQDGEAHITATDDRLARNILLPQTVVTRATHPNAPDESIGAAVPIVYSDGSTGTPLPLLLVDAVGAEYQVSEHVNAQMLAVYGAWPLGADRLKVVAADATQALIINSNRLRLLQRLTETKFGANTAAPTVQGTDGEVLNSDNLLDTDPSTLTTITTTAPDGIGRIRLDYAHEDPVGSNTIDVDLNSHRKVATASVTVHGNFVLDTIRQDGTTAIQGLFTALERRVQSAPQTEHFRVTGISLEADHTLRMTVSAINETGAAGTATDAYEVGQIVVTASYLVSGPFEPLYLPDRAQRSGGVFEDGVFEDDIFEEATTLVFQGRMDDDVGSVSGTPFQVLVNPVDVITSIMEQELGLRVDEETIGAARTARATWKMAGGLGHGWFRERTSALDVLHSLCMQAALYLYPKGDGTYVLKTVQALEAPAFIIGPAGSATDYLLYEAGDPGTPRTTWQRTLRYRGGRHDQVRNNFEVRYAYHPARQQFAQIAQASWLGTNDPAEYLASNTINLLQLSHQRLGPRDPYLLDADFLYDEATAYALLDLVIPYWLFPRQEVEFESTMAPLAVMLGDTVQVDTVGVPDRMRTQVFEVDRLRYDFEQGKIFVHGTQRTLLRLDYFAIRDQTGVVWYWWIDGLTQQLVRDLNPPAAGHTFLNDISVTPIPYYLILQDVTAATWYVLPTPLAQVQVQSTLPAVGTGYVGSPVWMAQDGDFYGITVNQFGQYTIEGTV